MKKVLNYCLLSVFSTLFLFTTSCSSIIYEQKEVYSDFDNKIKFEDVKVKKLSNSSILINFYAVINDDKWIKDIKFKIKTFDELEQEKESFLVSLDSIDVGRYNLNMNTSNDLFISEKLNNVNVDNFKNIKIVVDSIDYMYEYDYKYSYKFSLVKPIESNNKYFEDEFLGIEFGIKPNSLIFNLKNKTEKPIEIDWNKIAFVDLDSQSEKVIHSGIKYSKKDEIMASTTIAPLSTYTDGIAILSKANYDENKKEWIEGNFLTKSKNDVGKIFSVYLPLKIGENKKDYFFSFLISDFEDLTSKSAKKRYKM